MGHFGRRPIRLAWFAVVLPALVLNYFGQGALLLDRSGGGAQPVLLAGAGVGAVSDGGGGDGGGGRRVAGADLRRVLADPAGGAARLLPRVNIVHTSKTEIGQIYIPAVNNAAHGRLPRAGRRRSARRTNLAATYGVAVTGTMTITTHPVRRGGAEPLALELVEGGAGDGAVPGGGPGLRRRQPAQDPARRLVPAGGGRPGLHADVDLEEGPGAARRRWCARTRCRWTCSSRTSADAQPHRVPRHGRVPDLGLARARRRCCCIISSTTRCCTRR